MRQKILSSLVVPPLFLPLFRLDLSRSHSSWSQKLPIFTVLRVVPAIFPQRTPNLQFLSASLLLLQTVWNSAPPKLCVFFVVDNGLKIHPELLRSNLSTTAAVSPTIPYAATVLFSSTTYTVSPAILMQLASLTDIYW